MLFFTILIIVLVVSMLVCAGLGFMTAAYWLAGTIVTLLVLATVQTVREDRRIHRDLRDRE